MSDYRRLISYMYEYEGEKKGKNVGFVKLEARGGQCRLHVNVKRMYVGGNAIGAYLLGKNGEKTFLGNVFARNGTGEFQTTVDAENVDGRGMGLDTYYGLAVHDVKNPWRSYKTMWEDAPADCTIGPVAEEVLPGSADLPEEADLTVNRLQELEEEIAQSAELRPEPESSEDISPGPAAQSQPTQIPLESATPEQRSPEMVSPELENPEVLRYLQDTEHTAPDPEALWQEMRKAYPKIQPFDYDGTSEVLTIRPQDIGQLPRENWVYGNNSFLLHGYYNFRYLILIRLQNDGGPPRYLIGVPGHYYSSEKYMANMFGFPNFVLSKKQPPNDGRFGYWYTDIKMG